MTDTSRIREFLMINPTIFTGSNTLEDSESSVEKQKKIFEVMHIVDTD